MRRCFLLLGLRPSSHCLDQLALMFRELWRISRRLRGRRNEFDVICLEEAVCRQVVGQVFHVGEKIVSGLWQSLGGLSAEETFNPDY